MPRIPRIKGENCIYHIMTRGNERKNIYNSNDDKLRFIETLVRMKEKYNYIIYAFCLMDNHNHILIYDNGNDISKIIQSINISYTYYFNKTYARCGHLFQDRFISSIIDSNSYLLEASKYIHNNPVKASIANTPSQYKWSSFSAYTGNPTSLNNFVDTSLILNSLSRNKNIAVKKYGEYTNLLNAYIYNHPEDIIESDTYSIDEYKKHFDIELTNRGITVAQLNNYKSLRNHLIKEVAKTTPLTYRQIGELFQVSKYSVCRIVNN